MTWFTSKLVVLVLCNFVNHMMDWYERELSYFKPVLHAKSPERKQICRPRYKIYIVNRLKRSLPVSFDSKCQVSLRSSVLEIKSKNFECCTQQGPQSTVHLVTERSAEDL